MQEPVDFVGRTSTKSRAQRTIEDLFEATAQLLDEGTPEQLTTNHVAVRAGYSIGTLYRYFPNKLALLRAMAAQEIRAQQATVAAMIAELPSSIPAEPVVRIFVRAALRPFAGRHRVHAAVVRLLGADPGSCTRGRAPPAALLEPSFAGLPSVRIEPSLALSSQTQFTMIHAVTGAIDAALQTRPELIVSRAFEDQLVGLVLHFLHADKYRDSNPDSTTLQGSANA
jgi:AcrR family transcriptional regulator